MYGPNNRIVAWCQYTHTINTGDATAVSQLPSTNNSSKKPETCCMSRIDQQEM